MENKCEEVYISYLVKEIEGRKDLASILGCRVGGLPATYLGLLLGPNISWKPERSRRDLNID